MREGKRDERKEGRTVNFKRTEGKKAEKRQEKGGRRKIPRKECIKQGKVLPTAQPPEGIMVIDVSFGSLTMN